MEDNDPMMDGMKRSSQKLFEFNHKGPETHESLSETVNEITLEIMMMGWFKALKNLLSIVFELFADPAKKLGHYFLGERENMGLTTPFYVFMIMTLYGSMAELYNSLSFFTHDYINYNFVLLFGKIYVLASFGQYLFLKWRLHYRPNWIIFSRDMGVPIIFPAYVKVSKKLNIRTLSGFDFTRYVESSIWAISGLSVKFFFSLTSLGNIWMFIGLSIYYVCERRAQAFRQNLVRLRDSALIQREIQHAMNPSETQVTNHKSQLFNRTFINQLVEAQKSKSKLDSELEVLMKSQQGLDD